MRKKLWKKLAVVMSAVMMISLFGACSSGQEEQNPAPAADENVQEDSEQPQEDAASNELLALYDSIPTDPEHIELDTLPEL